MDCGTFSTNSPGDETSVVWESEVNDICRHIRTSVRFILFELLEIVMLPVTQKRML